MFVAAAVVILWPSALRFDSGIADADILGGRIATHRHDTTAARDHRTRARDTIALVARLGDDPNVLATWVSALLLLSDSSPARPILEKLAAKGYRIPKRLHLPVDPCGAAHHR